MTEKQRLKALLQTRKQQRLERARVQAKKLADKAEKVDLQPTAPEVIEHGRRERLLMLERFEEFKKEMEKMPKKGLQA